MQAGGTHGEVPAWGTPTFEEDVRRMFSSIARRYSLFDHVSTFGGDVIWRARSLWRADRLMASPPSRILDIGCGPGDLTFVLSDHYGDAEILGMDFTPGMVLQGEETRRTAGSDTRVGFGVGNALFLPFRDSTFDLVTSAFLLRNLKDLRAGFREMHRVLRPGGVMMALDITDPRPGLFGDLFHAYFDGVVPVLGAAFGNEGAYRYLSSSLRHVPPRSDVVSMLKGTGFEAVMADPQWMGAITSFLGRAAKGIK